jgi:hypothetical protein
MIFLDPEAAAPNRPYRFLSETRDIGPIDRHVLVAEPQFLRELIQIMDPNSGEIQNLGHDSNFP